MSQYIDARAEFTLREAGRLIGCSADVVYARLVKGLMPNARRDPHNGNSEWLVSAQDLVDAGLLDAFRLIPTDLASSAALESSPQHLIAQLSAREAELAARVDEVSHLRALVDKLVRAS